MKNYIQKYICKSATLFVGASLMLTGCSESFLDPDPQTMFEPETVFSTENGIKSVLAICDRQLKRNYVSEDSREMIALPTEYTFSDLMVPSATDKSGLLDNVDNLLRPNSDQSDEKNLGRTNSIYFFWRQNFEGVRNANTILSFIGNVPMDETLKNEYIGRAYFHRAYRYYSLVFQFGHVPLLTKLPEVPKQNYRSTHRDAILKKMVADMEFAVQWVPEQKDMDYVGMVNKGACRMLLSKLYMSIGEFGKAKEQLDILIDKSGYSLMEEPFGTFFEGGESASWPIARNVIWDLHRPENKLIAANKEVIMGMPNRGAAKESFIPMLTMRIMYPFFFDNKIKMPDGKQALFNYTRKGDLMCSDTIRRWYDVPHYIFCLNDVINQAKETNNGLEGATDGSIADWYLYRLAEAYLLRAEVKFYINPDDPTIKDDINIVRERAHCTEFYTDKVTIGDIMDERARELFFEEWRNVELTRVSLCLAISGRADEFGNTYKVETFDKQSGTDPEGGSYWYQRCIKKGMYNKGITINVNATKTDINYIMGKHNIYWPIPEKAIVSNGKAPLYQNYGYDGYDPNVQIWETWEEAVADEDKF